MNHFDHRNGPATDTHHLMREVVVAFGVLAAAVVVFLVVGQVRGTSEESASSAGAGSSGLQASNVAADEGTAGTVDDPAAALTEAAPTTAVALPDLDGDPTGETATAAEPGECLMDELSVRLGASGLSVTCVQQALLDEGLYTGAVTGQFDNATFAAVRRLQEDRKLFVDGVVGRETAISLGVWPDEESFVVRTAAPPAGAVDLLGFRLSSVASAGSDAPPLPEESGSGRRLVYERKGQRVWAVDDDGSIIRSWLVSGSKYSNELPGTHEVYSRSEMSTAWNGQAFLPKMVRYLRTDIGHIGFHAIPLHVADNSAYQTEAELGTRLSGGCQRQANLDAAFVWDFAQIGTKVVVI
jgi:peptidoglycan hydrolase-like protein with peptidoglycan-binding domain